MKKTIKFIFTKDRAKDFGASENQQFYDEMHTLVVVPVEIDLETLSPLARFFAEQIDIASSNSQLRKEWLVAYSKYSQIDVWKRKGCSDEEIEKWRVEEDDLPMSCRVTFPFIGYTDVTSPVECLEVVAKSFLDQDLDYVKNFKTGDIFYAKGIES